MGELVKNAPLLPAKIERQQLEMICKLLGSPSERIWPGYTKLPLSNSFHFPTQDYSELKTTLQEASPKTIELVSDLLVYDPLKRLDAASALRHPYFRREGPNSCAPGAIRMRLDEGTRKKTIEDDRNWSKRRRLDGGEEVNWRRFHKPEDDVEQYRFAK